MLGINYTPKQKDTRSVLSKIRGSSPIIKVAISWSVIATLCLTGYYFSRKWVATQKVKTLEIRQAMNEKFSESLEQARLNVERREAEGKK